MKESFFKRFVGMVRTKPVAGAPPKSATVAPCPVPALGSAPASPLATPGPADHLRTGIRTAVSVAKNALKSSISLLVIVVFAVSLWALLLRVVSPKPLIVVDSFEVSSDIEKQAGFSGKNAADVFTDELNAAASAGERFKGNDYASPHHYGRIRNVFRIPVQTTYGIQFSGISVDVIMDIYRRFRYDEWRISGDIVKAGAAPGGKEPDKVDVRVRVRRGNSSENWEIISVPGSVKAGVQTLAREMLSREQPELMGRANLQWALTTDHTEAGEANAAEHFRQAVEDFRGWANNEPTNPLPYFYMSIAYHYWPSRGQDSYDLALWSEETLTAAGRWQKGPARSAVDWVKSYWHGPEHGSDTGKYAMGTEASAEILMGVIPPGDPNVEDSAAMYDAKKKSALDHIQRSETMLKQVVSEGSPDADTEENLATAKAHRADIFANLSGPGGAANASGADLLQAYGDDKDAINIMRRILRQEPDNAGFHENLATEYLNTARVALEIKSRGMGLPNGEAAEDWYRLAATEAEDSLHLYPHLADGLIVAVDGLLGIENTSSKEAAAARQERAHLCRTMDLITHPAR